MHNKKQLDLVIPEFLKYLDSTFSYNSVNDNDNGKQIADGVTRRNDLYSDLLENYVNLTKKRNTRKEFHKWFFFWVMIVLIIGSCVTCFVYIFVSSTNENTVNIVSAFVSLISSLIAVPLIVAKYLFNNKEDDNITQIIEKTEEHDYAEIQLLKDHYFNNKLVKTSLSNNQEQLYSDLRQEINQEINPPAKIKD